MTWTRPKLGRVEGAEPCRCPLLPRPHQASYRFQRTDERGVVTEMALCLQKAAQTAADLGLVWPPGPWRD